MAMYVREVPCEICDTVEDVNSFCLNCKQKFCDNCKKGHLRAASSKHHKFAPIGDSLLPSSQKSEICTKHKEENQFYCFTCAGVACSHCLEEVHQSHKFAVLSKLVDGVHKEITDRLTAKEKELERAYSGLLHDTSAAELCQNQSTEIISYIKKTIKGWVDDLKSFEDELIEEQKKTADRETIRVERKTKEMETNRSKVTGKIQDVKVKVRTSSNVSLLQQKTEMLSAIDSIQIPAAVRLTPQLPAVRLNPSSKEGVRQILQGTTPAAAEASSTEAGTIAVQHDRAVQALPKPQLANLRDDLEIVNRFKVPESVFDVACVTESRSWLGTHHQIVLVDAKGKILLQQPHGNPWATSVTPTSSGEALYASSASTISRIDQQGAVSLVADIQPKKINYIRASKLSDHVYVATNQDILKLSPSGKIQATLTCHCPLALTELSDGRLVAVNGKAKMVLVTGDGSNIELLNQPKWKWGMFTTALFSDPLDRIILGNPFEKQIHVYKLTGDTMELLKEYSVNTSCVFGLATDMHDRLWIGSGSFDVIIADYCQRQ